MAPAPQQQQQGGPDNSLDFLWMIVLLVGSVVLVWYFAQEHIIRGVLAVRHSEINFIQSVLSGYGKIASTLHLPIPNTNSLVKATDVIAAKPKTMPLNDLIALSADVGKFLMYPVALIIAGLGVFVYFANIGERFKHVYSMITLRRSEYKIWPQVIPVMKVDLVQKDLDVGPWASSTPPMKFAKKHDLLIENRDNHPITVTIKQGAAHRVFSLQVGQFWRDITTFPLHVQALYAIFLARANQDRKTGDKLLNQIAESAGSQKLDFSGTKELVAKHRNSKFAQLAEQQHAYLLTVMGTLLETARTDGVMSTAEFLWLKPLDRTLWYMLNSVGRQTAFPEIGGAYAHWLAEKKVHRALRVPMVDEAVRGLENAVKDVLYEPDEV